MRITEVRIKLVASKSDKLRGFATITIDDALVIRDLKIIEGTRGLFVAMPSRKMQDRCPGCAAKNPLRSNFCNDCGKRLRDNRAGQDGRTVRLYADIAHPIHQEGRDQVQRDVIAAYQAESEASQREGWVAQRFDDLDYGAYDGA